jgi:hypothetical protein
VGLLTLQEPSMRAVARLILPLVVVATFASPARAQNRGTDTDKFLSRETALWGAVKNKEVGELRKVFGTDYVAVYDNGIYGRDDELGSIGKSTVRSIRLDDVSVRRVDEANVVVTYKAVVDGDYDGKSVTGTYNAMTLWHRKGNQWNVAAHTEVKAP